MALSLAGKTAIVTGAGSGINLAFARSLLSRKCNVLFADLALRPEAKEVVDNHKSGSEGAARALFQETDVREWSHLERMFSVAQQHFGDVDVVCPGAGVYEPPFSNFWQPPGTGASKDLRDSNRFASIDIDLTHPIRTTQLALAHFLSKPPPKKPTSLSQPASRPPKSIIHISSIAGQVTPLPCPLYNVCKHGINGFVRSLALLASDPNINVRVAAVAPGVIKTPLWTEAPEKMRMIAESDAWVTAEEVADAMTALVEQDEIEVANTAATSTPGEASGNDQEGTRKVKVEGGMILEVAKGPYRVVEQFMDPGPSGTKKGNSVGNMSMIVQETLEGISEGGWGAVS